MKANELRIGNIIASSGNPRNVETWVIGKVVSISSLESQFEQIEVETDEEFTWFFKDSYFGIPLTEEWLLKFGFTFWVDELGIKAFYLVYGIEYFCVATNGFWQLRSGLKNNDSAWRMGNNYPFLKYVHQLQNLYFALTGEELVN
jgi:hypothetical protein